MCIYLCHHCLSADFDGFGEFGEPGIERVKALADISRSRYFAIATKPVHQLLIRPILHNYGAAPAIPPSYIRVRAVV